MWVITMYTSKSIKMFEYETEYEAREAIKKMSGEKILTEIVYLSKSKPLTI